MKTALDLPDDLVREVKIRAAEQGKKLKDVVADLLRRGLDSPTEPLPPPMGPFSRDAQTGLPMVACRRPASAADRITPDRVARILLDQEVAWLNETGR